MAHRDSRGSRRATAVAALLACALATACTGKRDLADPVLGIETENGRELGVSTEYGVVFLGRTAERGEVLVEAFFGDGPSLERSVIEPVGGGLFTAEMEIRLPEVPLSFDPPEDGELLEVQGRRGWDRWRADAPVRRVDGVEGVLLDIPDEFLSAPDQIGAGVYRKLGEFDRELVGLVAGKVRIQREGRVRTYLAVVGPDTLWRLAAHRKDRLRRKPFVYREDIL
ncbi:MAG: hypothetical protein AAGA20_01080 [Planctomycetota bacterium]